MTTRLMHSLAMTLGMAVWSVWDTIREARRG